MKALTDKQKIKVMTVDDHPLTRGGIAFALQDEPDILVVAEGSSGSEGIQLFHQHRPDVTLMDLRLPDISGVTAMETILRGEPDARFIVLTTYDGDVPATRAYRAGAYGYLLKNMLSRDLVETIRKVHRGERVVLPEVARSMERYVSYSELTEREIAVLRLVAAGNSNKLIAATLDLSPETVKGHMKGILAKLRAEDRTHAVTIAQRRGFLSD